MEIINNRDNTYIKTLNNGIDIGLTLSINNIYKLICSTFENKKNHNYKITNIVYNFLDINFDIILENDINLKFCINFKFDEILKLKKDNKDLKKILDEIILQNYNLEKKLDRIDIFNKELIKKIEDNNKKVNKKIEESNKNYDNKLKDYNNNKNCYTEIIIGNNGRTIFTIPINIKHLELFNFDPQYFNKLQFLNNLEILDLTQINYMFYDSIAQIINNSLTKIIISVCEQFSDNFDENLPNLKILEIQTLDCTKKIKHKNIKKCIIQNLQTSLYRNNNIFNGNITHTEIIEFFNNFPKLEIIEISYITENYNSSKIYVENLITELKKHYLKKINFINT